MKCNICNRYFINRSSFLNLLKFPELCDDCKRKYKLLERNEIIPIDYGEVTYTYFLETNTLNINNQIFLMMHAKDLYQKLERYKNEFSAIIFIENYEFDTFDEWFCVIKNFSKIMFISLVFFDFSKYVSFF